MTSRDPSRPPSPISGVRRVATPNPRIDAYVCMYISVCSYVCDMTIACWHWRYMYLCMHLYMYLYVDNFIFAGVCMRMMYEDPMMYEIRWLTAYKGHIMIDSSSCWLIVHSCLMTGCKTRIDKYLWRHTLPNAVANKRLEGSLTKAGWQRAPNRGRRRVIMEARSKHGATSASG